jgi:hemerythrin
MNIKQLPFEPMNEVHNQEVELLNKLLNSIKNRDILTNIYKEFLADVKHHFDFEQNLMEKYNFFAKIPHKMEHERVLNELIQIETEKLNDYLFLDKYFNEVFIPWLDNHINTMDTVTSGYFNMIGATI